MTDTLRNDKHQPGPATIARVAAEATGEIVADDLATEFATDRKQELRRRALGLLARREHSRLQLQLKLERMRLRSGPPVSDEVHTVLDSLEADGSLDEQRFSSALLEERVRKGFGEYDVRHRLQQAGISRAIVAHTLQAEGTDWVELAGTVLERRFGCVSSAADVVDELADDVADEFADEFADELASEAGDGCGTTDGCEPRAGDNPARLTAPSRRVPEHLREMQRERRFLTQRGFTAEQVHSVLRQRYDQA